jgi:hypothetical protein
MASPASSQRHRKTNETPSRYGRARTLSASQCNSFGVHCRSSLPCCRWCDEAGGLVGYGRHLWNRCIPGSLLRRPGARCLGARQHSHPHRLLLPGRCALGQQVPDSECGGRRLPSARRLCGATAAQKAAVQSDPVRPLRRLWMPVLYAEAFSLWSVRWRGLPELPPGGLPESKLPLRLRPESRRVRPRPLPPPMCG